MTGFCSAHKHHEPGCKQCNMAPRKIDVISNCTQCSWITRGMCGKLQRKIVLTEEMLFPDWCPLKDYSNKWEEVHEIFLHIGDALMSIGTNANMGQDWYAMVDKLVDRGVTIAYQEKQKW